MFAPDSLWRDVSGIPIMVVDEMLEHMGDLVQRRDSVSQSHPL